MKLDPDSIIKELDDTWKITGPLKKSYVIVQFSVTCQFDHCYTKCPERDCPGLCSHLYSCSCPDKDPICKHIHRLHSLLNKDSVQLNAEPFNMEDMSTVPIQSVPDKARRASASEKVRQAKCASISSTLCALQLDTYSNLSDALGIEFCF
uniref:SWIM-type domain-containing protein n=1 Tax=Cacopsylla melanoneura TaxID=428564 RepID=A0A8D9E7V9_9HEMI